MKKYLIHAFGAVFLTCLCLFPTPRTASAEETKSSVLTECKSAYCMDAYSQTPVYEKEAERRLPIASMCKIMTLILTFEAIDGGRFDYETPIPVSEHAMSMGGSQVYLEAGENYSAERLIESVIVCSANDSCVALAEYVAGSDSSFVQKMNEKAQKLGCENTLFANCTGLPKDPQYSCAKDVARMFKELIRHEKFFEYSALHTDDFPHPDGRTTLITNTNKLTKRYNGCDGGKTGFTNEAGFCLAATAKRGDMRLIAVCIGAETGEKRFAAVSNMFDDTFANYQTEKLISAEESLSEKCPVKDGKVGYLSARPQEDVFAFYPVGEKPQYERKIKFLSVKAPVKEGDVVGEIVVYSDGTEYSKQVVVCDRNVERANYFDYLTQTAKAW